MKEELFCPNCDKLIDYENYDYWETEEDEEIEEIECPNCKCKLSVSWYHMNYFRLDKKEEEITGGKDENQK